MTTKAKFLLIIFYAFSVTLAAEPVVWNGNADTLWYNGDETNFAITTAEQLAGLAVLVNDGNNFENKIIVLNEDIILNDTTGWKLWNENTENLKLWMPIGGKIKHISENVSMIPEFRGTFEGNGHKISGLYINTTNNYQGLFGSARVYGSTSIIKNIGVLASWIKGGNFVGGIVGQAGTVYGSYFMGKVNGLDRVGGVIGNGTANDCYFIGSVNGNSYVGGIAGNSGNIANNYSMGTINGIGENIGGIVGYTENTVKDSYSSAIVNGSGNNVGGIVGYNNLGNILNSYYIKEVEGNSRIGGIAGRNDGTISNCYFTGTITGYSNVGGIVGANYYSGSVYNSYSKGNITGTISIGGIAGASGFMNSGSLINNYSASDIIGDNSVGGIAGTIYDGFATNNYSISSVNGTYKIGGIAGTISGGATIENNYFSGVIEGMDSIGGVAGNNYRGKVFNNYWNETLSGAIDGVPYGAISKEDIGNLIGVIDTEMKSIQFVETLNAFVDSANAAKTKKVYLSWHLDANYLNKGYPIFIYGLADASIMLATNSYIYDGKAKTPTVTVKLGNTTLIENTDYTVSYTNNIDVGEATINIIGINGYTGIKTVTFTIEQKETNTIQKLVSMPNLSILINAEHFRVQGITKTEKVRLLNLKGSILLNKVVQPNETVSIAHLPQGVYFINVGGKTFKFSKFSTF